MSETLTTTPVETKPLGRFARLRNRVSAMFAALAALIVVPIGAASATTPADPTGGAGDSLFTTLTEYLQGHLIVAVLALAAIGISVGMLLGWGKKAAKTK